MAEQRYQAVLAVIAEGKTVTEVAGRWGVSRRACIRGWPGMRRVGWRSWRTGRTGRALGEQEGGRGVAGVVDADLADSGLRE